MQLTKMSVLFCDPVTAQGQWLPGSYRHAPLGWYMLFAITNEGVPAEAFWVNLG